ncbi:MAG: SDR family oxidoreductase [Planctomycetota bacterium]|nr:SDR family oxidoreductase [Planctomycetota bacterium]
MRILVTGGAGLIGSHLCERLLADGHGVTCLDDFSSGLRENVAGLRDHAAFSLVEHDVQAPFDTDADRIYHLACPASPVHYRRDPVRTVRTNVLGAIHALDLARTSGARVLLASTSEVYGDPLVHPQPESYWGNVNPIGPRSCYDEGKRTAETLFWDYRGQYGVDTRIARIFNTYGPRVRLDDGRVISNFAVAALAGEPLVLYGDGAQTRSFCFVADLIEGLVALMESDVAEPVNLGNPEETSIRELAERIVTQTGSRSAVRNAAGVEDDPRRRCPDITRARERLGWAPRTPLAAGLETTIADIAARVKVSSP